MNKLLLLSGNDIPFEQAKLLIHQPKIKEISFIGQKVFFTGCQYLNFSKNKLNQEDRIRLENFNDFEVLMTIIRNKNNNVGTWIQMILFLLFPEYKVAILPNSFLLSKDNQQYIIDQNNFIQFKNIVNKIFCLQELLGKSKYNPKGPQARAIVQKLQQRHKKLAQLKGKNGQQVNIISLYISILSVGEHKDMNTLLNYTIYQLFDQFRRFRMKEEYDLYTQAKMAGAKDLDDVKHWMSDDNRSD